MCCRRRCIAGCRSGRCQLILQSCPAPLAKPRRLAAHYGTPSSERASAVVITQTHQPSNERLALTTMQAPLLIEQLYLPDKPIANTGILVTLTGQLDASTFVEAVRIVVGETDTLRIRLNMEGDTVYQDIVELPDYLVQQIDFSSSADPVAAADEWIEKHLWQTIVWELVSPFSIHADQAQHPSAPLVAEIQPSLD